MEVSKMRLIPFDVEAMLKALAELRSELEAAIAKGDVERVRKLVDFWIEIADKLQHMMNEEFAMWNEAIATNMRRLLRELEAMADERNTCCAELMLIGGKIIVYLTQSESADSGGGSTAASAWEKRHYA
jgi:hypothetical protein